MSHSAKGSGGTGVDSVVGDEQAGRGPPDERGVVPERLPDGGGQVVLVGDERRQRALRSGLDGVEPVQHVRESVARERRLPAELPASLFGLQTLDAVLEFRHAVFEPVDPLLGGLAVADGVGASLLFGVELALEVAFLLLEFLDAVLQRPAAEQLLEHRL